MDIEQRVHGFFIDTRRWVEEPDALTPEYPLIERGVLDSMGIFELVGFLEDNFGITVADDDLVPDNLETIASITRMVRERSPS